MGWGERREIGTEKLFYPHGNLRFQQFSSPTGFKTHFRQPWKGRNTDPAMGLRRLQTEGLAPRRGEGGGTPTRSRCSLGRCTALSSGTAGFPGYS